ncbi:carbon-nitrogen hydrolase family protein, partial [Mycobacterium xenopi 4042]
MRTCSSTSTRPPDRWNLQVVRADRTGRAVGAYRKTRLVPFGEYVPLRPLV